MSDPGGLDVGYEVHILGRFSIIKQGRPLALGMATERLVALLASRGKELPRHLIAGLLWPDCAEARARANLRSTLHRLSPPLAELVVSAPTRLRLSRSVVVDLETAAAAGERILAGTPTGEDLSTRMRKLLALDLLPDWYDDEWVIADREAFRQVRLHALEILCGTLASCGRHTPGSRR
jgi:DNA-binding SARP family transcriptional activator